MTESVIFCPNMSLLQKLLFNTCHEEIKSVLYIFLLIWLKVNIDLAVRGYVELFPHLRRKIQLLPEGGR